MTPTDPPASVSELLARQSAIAARIAKLRGAMAEVAAQVKSAPATPPIQQEAKK